MEHQQFRALRWSTTGVAWAAMALATFPPGDSYSALRAVGTAGFVALVAWAVPHDARLILRWFREQLRGRHARELVIPGTFWLVSVAGSLWFTLGVSWPWYCRWVACLAWAWSTGELAARYPALAAPGATDPFD